MHQDLMSPKFCGEGAPDFAVPDVSEGISKFPLPLALPYKTNAQGYPDWQDCAKKEFAEYYPTIAVGKAFQALYENRNGFADLMVSFWSAVASFFANEPNVVGYEIINEPYFGDIYDHPKILEPGYTDRNFLLPLYDRVTAAIRRVDKNHIVFFEPCVSDPLQSDFPHNPNNDTNLVYSYHVYCAFQPSPGDSRICKDILQAEFYVKFGDALKMHLSGMMTEFGAFGNDDIAADWINLQTSTCDSNLQGWAYWQYKYFGDPTTAGSSDEGFWFGNGTLQTNKVRALSRTFAQATQGRIRAMFFDAGTGKFTLNFISDVSIPKPTEIFISPFYYPNGFNVSISPAGSATTSTLGPKLIVTAVQNAVITVSVTAK